MQCSCRSERLYEMAQRQGVSSPENHFTIKLYLDIVTLIIN